MELIFKKLLLLLVVLAINSAIIAQNFGECGTPEAFPPPTGDPIIGCDYASNAWLNNYRTPGFWIPDENTPIKTILVNWVIIRDDNGNGGWQDCQEFRDQVDLMFEWANDWYSDSWPKGYSLTCEPTYTHITDTKIRFELNEIIFIDETDFTNMIIPGYEIYNYLDLHHPGHEIAMSHFFNMPTNPPYYWGRYGNYSDHSWVITHKSMWSPWFVVWEDHIVHVTHEYGHAVGLHHTYDAEVRNMNHYDFLDDVFGLCAEPNYCNPIPPSNEVCYLKVGFFEPQPEPYPIMYGHNKSRYISPKHGGRMHRALSIYEQVFRVDNRNMHRYVKEELPYSVPLTIANDETWDFAIKMYQNIVVEAGVNLTITCEVKMPVDGRIIVKQGGKLIVDGGHITSAHTSLWRGIEVWGDPTQSHDIESAHGIVELKNGAIIENAKVAISTTQKDENGYLVQGYHGGLVKADQAIFENNKRAVEIWPFDYTNNSYFKRCSFITSEELPDNNNFEYFIVMSDVDGVIIQGCDFENTRPAFGYTMDGRGIGIFSNESQYYVSAYDPEGSNIENYFGKLKYGILANGFTPSKTPSIKACSLEYNRTGIYLGGITSASVLSNYFLVESFDENYDTNIYCGLYLDNSTQYHVEDNFFEHDVNTSQDEDHTIGITVNNSGDQDNWIYRNIFKTLDIGILAQNQNRNQYGTQGLFIKCNDFGDNNPNDPSLHDNTYDIAVTKFGDCDYPGLKQSQGSNASASSPAGNRFSQASNGIVDSDFSNPETLRLFYFQHDPTNEPRLNLTYHIPLHVTKQQTMHPWNESECCPPSFYPGGSGEIESAISSFQSDADSVNTLLTAMVDGGNTQELESDVILSTPVQSYDLYTDLTMKSPYLTDTVMVEAVRKENVLSEVMVRDILVANPQSAKSNEVMDELDSRINPLPDYMIAEIEQGNDSLGDKEIMEASKYHYLQKRNICINDLKRYYKTDTSGLTNRDTLIDFLVNSNSIQSKYELAFEHLLDKDYTNTNAVLTNIPSQFVLSSEDYDLYEDYSDYIDIIINLKQNNNQYYDIDSLHINILDSLSNDIYSNPGAYARNILLYNDAISYNEPYILPDSTLKAEEYERSSSTTLQDYPEFKIYPNPAANYVTIEYNLKSQSCNGYIEFINLQGKMIRHEELNSGKHSKIITLNDDFSSGTYLCKLVCNGQVLDTEKLTIIR